MSNVVRPLVVFAVVAAYLLVFAAITAIVASTPAQAPQAQSSGPDLSYCRAYDKYGCSADMGCAWSGSECDYSPSNARHALAEMYDQDFNQRVQQ